MLAIDKPAGWVVNAAQTVREESVQEWIARSFQFPISNFQSMRNGIVHRLDKETSGALLIAKTPEAFKELQRQFKSREVEKTYVALVHGRVTPGEGTIRAPVGRLPWNRERFGVLAGGREAETGYKRSLLLRGKVIREIGEVGEIRGKYSLVEFYPKTGRTHQIRVHARSIGHPVVGDSFYAGRKTARADRQWCPRLFLHASRIVFKHPHTGKRITVEAKLPTELQSALRQLATGN